MYYVRRTLRGVRVRFSRYQPPTAHRPRQAKAPSRGDGLVHDATATAGTSQSDLRVTTITGQAPANATPMAMHALMSQSVPFKSNLKGGHSDPPAPAIVAANAANSNAASSNAANSNAAAAAAAAAAAYANGIARNAAAVEASSQDQARDQAAASWTATAATTGTGQLQAAPFFWPAMTPALAPAPLPLPPPPGPAVLETGPPRHGDTTVAL